MSDPFPGPLAREMRDNPYPCYRWLLEERPVYHNPRANYWALSRYADVSAAARDYAVFSSAMGVGQAKIQGRTLLGIDPPDHDRLRRLIARAFLPAVMERFEARIEAICDELIDASAGARGEFDLVEDFAFPLPMIVVAELLGLDRDRREEYRAVSRALVATASQPGSVKAAWMYQRAMRPFLLHVAEVMEARRREPREDLISILVQASEEDGALTAQEIRVACELFLVAGNETTNGLIGNAAMVLAAHPEEARQVVEDPELIGPMVEEVLRFDSPVQAVFRTTTRAVEVRGVAIPEGAKVALLWAAANRDPEMFAEPDRFCITRSPNPHFGFGHGIHRCVGAGLARMETHIAGRVLLRRFRELRPLKDRAERNSGSQFLRSWQRLPMAFTLR